MKPRKMFAWLVLFCLVIVLSGCGQADSVSENALPSQSNNDPVKLTVFHGGGEMTDEEYQKRGRPRWGHRRRGTRGSRG